MSVGPRSINLALANVHVCHELAEPQRERGTCQLNNHCTDGIKTYFSWRPDLLILIVINLNWEFPQPTEHHQITIRTCCVLTTSTEKKLHHEHLHSLTPWSSPRIVQNILLLFFSSYRYWNFLLLKFSCLLFWILHLDISVKMYPTLTE